MRTLSTSVMILTVMFLYGCAPEQPFPGGRVVDLTYSFDSTSIYWPTEKGFIFEKGPEGITPGGYFYTANRFWTPEHGGTHMDAPIHFSAEGQRLEEVPVDRLIGAGVLIDVSGKCEADRDYRVSVEDFEAWEQKHGRLPEGAIVLLRTGFGKYWPDRVRYMGSDERGQEAVAKLHFPGLHPDAAKWLVTQRSIHAIGLDTPSIDYGQSKLFESHVILYAQNIPAFENVANLDQLPETGFNIIALPMKIRGGSGGPLRIVAVL